jgi:hypothetical protein
VLPAAPWATPALAWRDRVGQGAAPDDVPPGEALAAGAAAGVLAVPLAPAGPGEIVAVLAGAAAGPEEPPQAVTSAAAPKSAAPPARRRNAYGAVVITDVLYLGGSGEPAA